MKKIMFYIDTMYRGGAQRVMCILLAYFVEKNYDTVLVNDFVQDKSVLQYDVPNETKRMYLRNNIDGNVILKNIERIAVLRKYIKKEKPDVVLSFLGRPNERMLLATLGMKVKKVVSVRNDPNYEYGFSEWKKTITGGFFCLADGCVFQTEDAALYFPNTVQKKSRIIFNPVEDHFFKTVRSSIPRNIIAIGRLESQKNHKLLIDAFAQIVKEFPEEKLIIYGEGSLRKEIEQHIERLGLSERVELPGNVSRVNKVLAKAKLFVLSSNYEGMPNALMEAMAMGVPCISTDCPCGGPRMLLSKSEAGVLTSCGDSIALAAVIKKLLRDQEYAEMLGKRAAEVALDFEKETICKEWELYLFKAKKNYL